LLELPTLNADSEDEMKPFEAGNAKAVDSWEPYVPDDKMPWDLARVVHLHHRAGFAATWAEIQRDLKDGPDKSIDRLIKGEASAHVPAEFNEVSTLVADAAVTSGEIGRLKAWWIYRMIFSPDPLGEKLALLWHNHFASSNAKIRDVGVMRAQNEVFRKHSRSPFGELLNAVMRDPAVLIFLDAPVNRKGHANENLARELMELFTLGIGNYSEADVKDAARALTGWSVENGSFTEVSGKHDDGEKTILGKTGKWSGHDLIRMLLDHPSTADRLSWRLGTLFFGEAALPPEARQSLADKLRQEKLNLGSAVATILRSRLFFAEGNIRTRIASPVEFVIASTRALEMFDPAPSTLVLADWCGRLGEDLFEPPNVGGWPGGRTWISPRTTIGRANAISSLLHGDNANRPLPFDATELTSRHGMKADDLVSFYVRLLYGREPTNAQRKQLAGKPSQQIPARLLTAPEGQLN
jgi:uncharacterized protein (DUF1800 family)